MSNLPCSRNPSIYRREDVNPKNHICSLAWTGFCLYSGINNSNLLSAVAMPTFLGVPTILVGVNIREIANLFNISGSEARQLLNQLYQEERIDMRNHGSDMAIVYTPIN